MAIWPTVNKPSSSLNLLLKNLGSDALDTKSWMQLQGWVVEIRTCLLLWRGTSSQTNHTPKNTIRFTQIYIAPAIKDVGG